MMLLFAAIVTFADVQPVLQQRCVVCHRPGEIGPMPLGNYKQARPWAKAILEAVKSKTMPPWFADERFGHFKNDPRLTPQEIETIQQWVASGATEGPPPPPARAWVVGWSIPKPDLILEMPQPVRVPVEGELPYQHIVLKGQFKEDKWVTAVEVRPTDRSVVHHIVLYVREPGNMWLAEAKPGVPLGKKSQTTSDILTVYTPGQEPFRALEGMAKLIPAGSDLVLQIHYTPNGKAVADRTKIGLVFANSAPPQRVLTLQLGNGNINIPPGEANYSLSRSGTLPNDCYLLNLFPHMHLRGKAFEYLLWREGGRGEMILRVSPYRFNWQLTYQLPKPRFLAKGTRLVVTGYFDNSKNNKFNPDPDDEVHYGEQSWEEMMIGFFDVAVPSSVDKVKFFLTEPRP